MQINYFEIIQSYKPIKLTNNEECKFGISRDWSGRAPAAYDPQGVFVGRIWEESLTILMKIWWLIFWSTSDDNQNKTKRYMAIKKRNYFLGGHMRDIYRS